MSLSRLSIAVMAAHLVTGVAIADHQPVLDPDLDWPAFYDPAAIRNLHIKIKRPDWDTIRADDTYEVEVPALFWTEQEEEENAFLVSVRRKSATPLLPPGGVGPVKVSFKIDINEYELEDPRAHGSWHKLKKLSLENGDDVNVVAEATAWYLHRLAARSTANSFPNGAIPGVANPDALPVIYPGGHLPGLANWATLTAHVVCSDDGSGGCLPQGAYEFDGDETEEPQGVYVNVEQPDKQFLKNRGLWESNTTWLFKQDYPTSTLLPEVKEAPDSCDPTVGDCLSPGRAALWCAPFVPVSNTGRKKSQLTVCNKDTIEQWVNMPILLATGAINAFSANPDELLNHEKNFFYVDYQSPDEINDPGKNGRRLHLPWDLDTVFSNGTVGIYGDLSKRRRVTELRQTGFQSILLKDYDAGDLAWCTKYNGFLSAMSWSDEFAAAASAYLEQMKATLVPLLIADPNSKMGGDPEGQIDSLKSWLAARGAVVTGQITADCGL